MAIQIEELNSQEYEHPLDKVALDALQKTPGLDIFIRKIYDLGLEPFYRLQLIGSNIKITSSSFPSLFEILEQACLRLNLKKIPDFYLQNSFYPPSGLGFEGRTFGVEQPIIVITTEAVECLTDQEILFIIGREVGHIKSQHILYLQIGYLLPLIGDLLLGIGSLLTGGLKFALIQWERMADYTADRAGLLACQDVAVATTALAKIAGLPKKYFDSFNIDDFITQVREFEGLDDAITNKLLKQFSLAVRDRAWTIMRANELLKWVDAGHYQQVLDRKTLKPATVSAISVCPNCGAKLEASDAFCSRCGTRLNTLVL